MKISKKYFFSTNQENFLQLQKWNKTYLAVILGYKTIIWHHQSQNLGFYQVLIRAHCAPSSYPRSYWSSLSLLISFVFTNINFIFEISFFHLLNIFISKHKNTQTYLSMVEASSIWRVWWSRDNIMPFENIWWQWFCHNVWNWVFH